MAETTRVLFVCMGNICRSPAAEGVFRKLAVERGLDGSLDIDSCGTIGYHTGELPDPRMRQTAERRGYSLTSRARQFSARDFERFDHIIAMDRENRGDILGMDRRGKHAERVRLLCDLIPDAPTRDVPDPYYDGPEGFERCLDLIEEGCRRLLDEIADGSE